MIARIVEADRRTRRQQGEIDEVRIEEKTELIDAQARANTANAPGRVRYQQLRPISKQRRRRQAEWRHRQRYFVTGQAKTGCGQCPERKWGKWYGRRCPYTGCERSRRNNRKSSQEGDEFGVIIKGEDGKLYTYWHINPADYLYDLPKDGKRQKIKVGMPLGTIRDRKEKNSHLHFACHDPEEPKDPKVERWEVRSNANSCNPLK